MPRSKKEDGAEPKKRSRTGCWQCKARKIKCGEEKPACTSCVKSGERCDYSIRLNWSGRSRKDKDGVAGDAGGFTFVTSPPSATRPKSGGTGHEHVFSAQHIAAAPSTSLPPPLRPASQTFGQSPTSQPTNSPTPEPPSSSEQTSIDPRLNYSQSQNGPHEHQSAMYSMPHPPLPHFTGTLNNPAMTERSAPTSVPSGEDFRWSPQHSAKRVKLRSPQMAQSSPVFAVPQYPFVAEQSPASTHITPFSLGSIVNTPATPSSSMTSGSSPSQPGALNVQDPPDLRRLSVKSLLSDPSEDNEPPRIAQMEAHGYRSYGYDHGFPDLDRPQNDDNRVVFPQFPDLRRASAAVSEVSTSSADVEPKQIAFEPGGYYAQPVPIRIPRSLEPLPAELKDNQMNLLYFHHFINHTGRIMVAHDCPENPFRRVLPRMAVRNPHLLHLLLAFSASHRAKLLDHPEPANRIAEWMTDVLPALRQALDEPSSPGSTADPADPSSLAPLATAIMLAALEIYTPNTFAVPIPWQQHLQIARRMIIAKGGLHHLAQKADGVRDKAIFFLSRWFAYLDVLGSLSNRDDQPLFGAYNEDGGGLWLVNRGNEEIYQIDCFFGFSGHCIALLAQVAELAAQCDNQRIEPVSNRVNAGWNPSDEIRQHAEELKNRLFASAHTPYRGCMHADPEGTRVNDPKHDRDAEEINATNQAYHWAGVIHLLRRVLALPSTDPEVQDTVRRVLYSLSKVRRGSSAESCLLFPMFTAGCEAQSEQERSLFMDRLAAVEGWGMQHVGRARALMQTVWSTGRPWETLVNGEFFG